MKRIFVGLLVSYSLMLFTLLAISFKNMPNSRTVILMGATLFAFWVLVGGMLQMYALKNHREKLETVRESPVRYFVLFAIVLACIEEAIAVLITNLAPLYGAQIGEAYITASTNYFTTISLHSVIVFIPMFLVLGIFLKRYTISPFQTLVLFGFVGVIAETTFAGTQALFNAPFWILVYGLMVYLPAYVFSHSQRRNMTWFLYPVLVVLVTASALLTAWIPMVLNVPRTEFPAEPASSQFQVPE